VKDHWKTLEEYRKGFLPDLNSGLLVTIHRRQFDDGFQSLVKKSEQWRVVLTSIKQIMFCSYPNISLAPPPPPPPSPIIAPRLPPGVKDLPPKQSTSFDPPVASTSSDQPVASMSSVPPHPPFNLRSPPTPTSRSLPPHPLTPSRRSAPPSPFVPLHVSSETSSLVISTPRPPLAPTSPQSPRSDLSAPPGNQLSL
jgi:hypothetical protein